jgi:predicted GH43/DUF377 family glycosyl hydrolase
MFYWKKLGKVFTPQGIVGRSWMSEFAQAPATLVFDDFVRVYFSCRPPADERGQYVSYSAWVDLDRRNLLKVIRVGEQPVLGLGQRGTFDEFGTYPFSVIRDGNRVLAYYGGWTRCASVPFNVAIGMATSNDNGESFVRAGTGPVLSYTPNEPFVLSGPKIRCFDGLWYLWYIAGRKWKLVDGRPEPVYKIRMARSEDGLIWERENRDLIKSRLEEDEAQASPDVIQANGLYHMFFCYRYSSDYRGKEKGYRIGYASSADLLHWERDDDKAGIELSGTGWDSQMLSYPHVFHLDGSTWMLYLGNDVGREGFGLARLEGKLG